MANRNYSLTILGSYSGRNAGDAAILASMMGTISRQIGEDTVFEVPTTHPDFIEKHYGKKFKVRPVNVMPWTGSIRLLGIPTFRSIARTDAVLITDGIIFDVNLWNPLFNFLIILIFLVPFAKLMGKKVVCYNIGIGPLRSYWGRRFAKFVGDYSDLIMVRDEDSVKLFREIGVEKEIHLTADAVFQNWGTPEKLPSLLAEFGIDKAAAEGRLIGVNVTRYADRWLAANEKIKSKESFLERLAQVIVRLKTEKNIESAIFITQIMDVAYGRELVAHVSRIYSEKTGKSWTPA
ncbi:MAG: polysaccharide pyruvyl transferase family protein, partial [bacterium]|nr:polysaccharide pyruvyl transferase family protein [bacterium]